jgi:hypothetical protein
MAQRRATDVLASLASAFPELYDAAQQEPGEAAQAQASTLSTVASADLGSAMKETKHQDAYEEKITRITGKVGACVRQDMFRRRAYDAVFAVIPPSNWSAATWVQK